METNKHETEEAGRVMMSSSLAAADAPPSAEEGEAVLSSLSQRLRDMKGHVPSLSAIAMKGEEKLVKTFLTETVGLEGDLSSGNMESIQLYIASFWGFSDMVTALLEKGADVNHSNAGTLWTPLHAATFQEHGKVVMLLLERGANPDQADAEGRTPKDFASASTKIWPHFAALGYSRTTKENLISKGIIEKARPVHTEGHAHSQTRITRVSAFARPGSAYVIQNPQPRKKSHMDSTAMAACLSGDVLHSDWEHKVT